MLHIDKMKPLFNGKEILNLLNIKAGKEVGVLLDFLLEEQIKDPKFDKTQAIEFLQKKKEEIVPNVNNNDEHFKKKENKKKKK